MEPSLLTAVIGTSIDEGAGSHGLHDTRGGVATVGLAASGFLELRRRKARPERSPVINWEHTAGVQLSGLPGTPGRDELLWPAHVLHCILQQASRAAREQQGTANSERLSEATATACAPTAEGVAPPVGPACARQFPEPRTL
ncbi:hypothetical protein OPT61_g9757 [Boeremia exigua]|uniref:Uncharacterized protein n=1 Tax=Boeremia exigua TaxID=749465 RepID=A0ACC2HSQ8_9PLEO|nr:hypothetical protein OPT61_g9757 [Boeremia exigua]